MIGHDDEFCRQSSHLASMSKLHPRYSRRAVLGAGTAAVAATMVGSSMPGSLSVRRDAAGYATGASRSLPAIDPALLSGALGALDRHRAQIWRRDRIAIVDFSAPSSAARLHVLDLEQGKAKRFLVAHGSGSDPDHTGFLQRFSNTVDSNASSEGAFVTADYYLGKHGRSQRLLGLDQTNCNALTRSIVVHGAWYADAGIVTAHGKLGRSQGCFAVGDEKLAEFFESLGEGRLIYAAKT